MNERISFEKPRVLELGVNGLAIAHGLSEEVAAQLIKKSRQPYIRRSVPKDATSRFKNLDTLSEWLNTGREVYALTNEGDLAGIIWYGKKRYPFTVPPGVVSPQDTFAIRLYNNYRGKGLALPFMWTTMRDYRETLQMRGQYDNFRGIWLSTTSDNEGARELYRKFGFNEVGFSQGEDIMVLPPSKMDQILGA